MTMIEVSIRDQSGELETVVVEADNYEEALSGADAVTDQLSGIDEGVITITIRLA